MLIIVGPTIARREL